MSSDLNETQVDPQKLSSALQRGKIFLIVGPRAIGKSTLVSHLSRKNRNLLPTQKITTRPQRSSNNLSEIISVTENEFEDFESSRRFFITRYVDNVKYGLTGESFSRENEYIKHIAITGLHETARALLDTNPKIPTIFLDLPENEIINRLISRNKIDKANPKSTFNQECDRIHSHMRACRELYGRVSQHGRAIILNNTQDVTSHGYAKNIERCMEFIDTHSTVFN
ncbi:hypothetical protein [Azospirillum cavernae]|uniref:hypothetical protein n=1 Tax=Azospirillum cavernae TaxID=2320860 RepID=UPI0011C3D142|nr:hypothetical protein [Azospirillum cavernae]